MRKLIGVIGAMVVIGTLYVVPAQANGTCTPSATVVRSVTTGSVTYKGKYSCGNILHLLVTAEATLWRRTPGASWNPIEETENNCGPCAGVSAVDGYPWLCAKDYKTTMGGVAKDLAGGGVHSGGDSSTVLTHTC